MLTVAIPLWILEHTTAPRPVIQLIFVLSVVLVVVSQKRFSRGADDASGSRRCLVRAAWSLSLGAAAVGLTGLIHAAGWVVVLLISAAMLVTAAELWQTVGGWNLSYALAPEARRPEYLAVFSLGPSAQRVIGPPLFTSLVIPMGAWGWLMLAAAFAVLAPLTPILLGPAREAPGTPARPATPERAT
jgi:MFS family permease